MKHISLLLLMLLSLAAQPRRAQTALLALTGNVQTGAQQALGGAAVTLIHVPPGKGYSAASNNVGRFVATNFLARSPDLPGRRRRQLRRLVSPAQVFTVPGHYDAKSGNYLYDTGALTALKLPGGASIANVGINSTESRLHRFLSDPTKQADTLDLSRNWYNFDRVFFETGKATLTPESMSQLRNVVTLLRAYPTVRVKIGSYTDSTGIYKVNKMLSEARARTAWASLVEMGISPARIAARGYGPRYGIASNSTEEGRAMNRRLSVKVLAK